MAPLTLAQKLAKFGFPRSIISAFDKTVTYETNPVTGGNELLFQNGSVPLDTTDALRAKRKTAWSSGPIIVAPDWTAAQAVVVGDARKLSDGTHLTCTAAGTTGGTAPSGFLDGRPITDGTATWYLTGFRKQTSDYDAPTVTYFASAAAAGLTETKFATGSNPVSPIKSFDAVLFNRTSGAFVGAVGVAPGNTSFSANATGDVAAASNIPVSIAGDAFSVVQNDAEFLVNDSKFMLCFHNSSLRYQVLIDGKPLLGQLQLQTGVSGSGIVIDFNGEFKERRVTVSALTSPLTFRGVAMTAQGSMRAVPSSSDVFVMFGDSFLATVSPAVYDGHLGSYLKRYLGIAGVVNAGVGGSGYITKNANTYNVGEVVANINNQAIFSYLRPNHVFIHAGGNDRGTYSVDVINAAALTTWRSIRSLFPNAKITISDGYSGNSGPDANAIAVAAGLATTFAAWGDANSRFVSAVGAGGSAAYINGVGNAGIALVAGNSSIFTSTDTTHPSPSGSRYLARRYADAIEAAWNGNF